MMKRRLSLCGVVFAAALMLVGCGSSNNNTPDAGNPDSGMPDSGTPDSGTPDSGTPDGGTTDGGSAYRVRILHTNDLHSYMEAQGPTLDYSPLTTGDDTTVGGFARLAGAIEAERASAGDTPVLLLDSGDFMMGTLFEAIGTSQAAELTEMGKMGYDAITLGNHEFDWTSNGLAAILNAAVTGGFSTPIVASNTVFSDTDTGDDSLQGFATAGVIVPKLVKTLSNGLKVGIFGLMGKDAASFSPLAAPVTFANQVDTARAMVNELRNTDHVDLVIALSHSSSFANGTGEDVDLANSVAGIDVIISGHSHQAIPEPLVKNKALIVQTGAYGSNLGELDLTVTPTETKKVTEDAYALIPLDDSVTADADVQARVDGYVSAIDGVLTSLSPLTVTYSGVVAHTAFDLADTEFAESQMGDLVTDAYRNVTYQSTGSLPDLAVEVGGNIRTALEMGTTGNITFADLFKVLPLGVAAADGMPGYPLVTYYLNGTDIKGGLELSAAAKDLQDDSFFLQVSGMNYTFDTSLPLFNRVTSATIAGNPVDFADTTTCYQVVSTQYLGELLGLVQAKTGVLSVTPKESDCSTVITDMGTRVVDADAATTGMQPLHQWLALYLWMGNFSPDTTAAPEIPAVPYAAPEGRITIQ